MDIKYFYEGLPSWEDGIPWAIWIKPLLVWGSFAMALYLVMICMMVILRRQWIEHVKTGLSACTTADRDDSTKGTIGT